MSDKLEKLAGILGFDPQGDVAAVGAISEAVLEIANERKALAKLKAKELIAKAIDMSKKKAEIDKAYKQESIKWDKEMGKLMKEIEGLSNGGSQDESA